MIKPIVTAASFTLGGAGVILVGYLGVNPRAFTHPIGDLPFTEPAPRSTHAEAPVAVDTNQTLVMPEVRLVASPRPATRNRSQFDPCSDWNDVGAMFVEARGATGVRRVRHLCSKTER